MATVLSFLSGRQITNSNGVPQAGALLYHYQAGTTSNLTVYSNQAGTIAHSQPVVCDSGGFAPVVYIDSTSDWKVVIQTAGAATLQTYDNLPKAVAEVSASNFAPPLLSWVQVTSSPQTLTAANAGNAYEVNTTSNSVTFNLPSAASVGNGKGFVFKKTASPNSMIIDPSGTETTDNSSTALTFLNNNDCIGMFSNGAEWYKVFDVAVPINPTVQRFTSGSGTYTPPASLRFIRGRLVGGGGGGSALVTNDGTNGATTTFGGWTVGGGVGGGNAGGTGGTGGSNGTGTLITRHSGQDGDGGKGAGGAASGGGGSGGNSPFGGAGVSGLASPGTSAKANTGSGGGAAGATSGQTPRYAGGAGEYVEFLMTAAQIGASLSYAVGAAGTGGAAGTRNGGDGGAGVILIEEYY